jgi:replicative DNA helicase
MAEAFIKKCSEMFDINQTKQQYIFMEKIFIPHNDELEIIVLGSMLTSINHVNTAIDKLKADDFFSEKNRTIFLSMISLYNRNDPIEPETVYAEMNTTEKKYLAYLFELTQYKASFEIDSIIVKIKNAAIYRKFIYKAQDFIKDASRQEIDPQDFFSSLSHETEAIFLDEKETKKPTIINKILDNFYDENTTYLDYVQKRQEMRQSGVSLMKGVPTNIEVLDKELSGLCPGHMIIIAARPGIGKTTLAINMIKNLIEQQIPVLFFSLEMTSFEVSQKIISIESEVPANQVDSGLTTSDEFQKLVQAENKLRQLPLIIEEEENLTPAKIRARTKRYIKSHNIKAVFVDYLTCITPDQKTNTREEGYRDISGALRAMAKSFRIPFICLAQENRDAEKTEVERAPKPSDLGQSGGIEQDAHTLLQLRRPEKKDPYNKPGILEIYVTKNRFGRESKQQAGFKGAIGQVYNLPKLESDEN